MAIKLSKKVRATQARKNAEAVKAKKKAIRTSKGSVAVATKPGQKVKSLIGQAKRKNK